MIGLSCVNGSKSGSGMVECGMEDSDSTVIDSDDEAAMFGKLVIDTERDEHEASCIEDGHVASSGQENEDHKSEKLQRTANEVLVLKDRNDDNAINLVDNAPESKLVTVKCEIPGDHNVDCNDASRVCDKSDHKKSTEYDGSGDIEITKCQPESSDVEDYSGVEYHYILTDNTEPLSLSQETTISNICSTNQGNNFKAKKYESAIKEVTVALERTLVGISDGTENEGVDPIKEKKTSVDSGSKPDDIKDLLDTTYKLNSEGQCETGSEINQHGGTLKTVVSTCKTQPELTLLDGNSTEKTETEKTDFDQKDKSSFMLKKMPPLICVHELKLSDKLNLMQTKNIVDKSVIEPAVEKCVNNQIAQLVLDDIDISVKEGKKDSEGNVKYGKSVYSQSIDKFTCNNASEHCSKEKGDKGKESVEVEDTFGDGKTVIANSDTGAAASKDEIVNKLNTNTVKLKNENMDLVSLAIQIFLLLFFFHSCF